MKRKLLSLFAPVVLALGAAGPASAADPSSNLFDFACNVELNVFSQAQLDSVGYDYTSAGYIVTIIPEVTGGTTERHCTGSTPDQNVQIRCDRPIDDFVAGSPAGSVTVTGFECRVSRDDCPGDGPEEITTVSNLKLVNNGDGTGSVDMQCNLN